MNSFTWLYLRSVQPSSLSPHYILGKLIGTLQLFYIFPCDLAFIQPPIFLGLLFIFRKDSEIPLSQSPYMKIIEKATKVDPYYIYFHGSYGTKKPYLGMNYLFDNNCSTSRDYTYLIA